jgi:hypothetical protein
MEWLTKDIISALLFLTPGFLTAWIFYGLTALTSLEFLYQAL